MRQYLTALIFKALALLFSIPSGGLNSCRKYKISLYQVHASSGTVLWEFLLDDSACSLIKLIPKALQFDSASNLAKPCPFINLVDLISRSNSRILAIHLPLLPSMSGYIRMSFIEVEGKDVLHKG